MRKEMSHSRGAVPAAIGEETEETALREALRFGRKLRFGRICGFPGGPGADTFVSPNHSIAALQVRAATRTGDLGDNSTVHAGTHPGV
jgi:hypothetical protein